MYAWYAYTIHIYVCSVLSAEEAASRVGHDGGVNPAVSPSREHQDSNYHRGDEQVKTEWTEARSNLIKFQVHQSLI